MLKQIDNTVIEQRFLTWKQVAVVVLLKQVMEKYCQYRELHASQLNHSVSHRIQWAYKIFS